MRDPASEIFQDEIEAALGDAAYAVELSVLRIIADRLENISPEDTLADVMKSIPADMARITKLLTQGGAAIAEASEGALLNMAEANEEWADTFYAQTNAERTNVAAPIVESAIADAVVIAEACTPKNLMIICRDGASRPVREAFVHYVSDAVAAMRTGSDYQTAITRAVGSLASSGLRIRYESGATRELFAVVRMHVMSNYRRAMVASRWAMGAEFGADGVEISAHTPCAPDHLPYQGKQMTTAEFAKAQKDLPRDLVTGANCRHTAYPIVLGISQSAYTDEQLNDMRSFSNKKVSFTGLSGEKLSMTRYEATQYQRELELSVRKQHTFAWLSENTPEAERARQRAKRYEAEYMRVSREIGVPTMPSRLFNVNES